MEIKILEMTQEKAGHGATKLKAQLSFSRPSEEYDLVTAVEGQGRNLADAAEALAKSDKLSRMLAEHFKAALKEQTAGEPKESTGPKLSESSGQDNPEGQDRSSSNGNADHKDTPKRATTSPHHSSRGPVPTAAASAPTKPGPKGSPTPVGTKQELKSSPDDVVVDEF